MTTTSTLLSRVWLARFLFLLAAISLSSAVPARAAPQTFWPFNLFPPPTWSLSYTDASPISASVPTVGTIMSREFVLAGFANPITLPSLNNSTAYNNTTTTFAFETSLDGGANWAPYSGNGSINLTLNNTSDTNGVRLFTVEMSSQNIPVNGAYGAATIRENPALASLGELVVSATNGGYFFSGFVNFNVEVSVNNGANWFAASPAAYVELTGSAGIPATMSISKSNTVVTVCWRTEPIGQYQLQKLGVLGGANWVNVGTPQPGNGSELCVMDTLSTSTNQFYRVQLSP